MEKEVKIYLEFSDEIEELLAKNNIDLKAILKKSKIGKDVEKIPNPFEMEDGIKTRDWILTFSILVGGAYAAKMVLPEINELLKTILGRDVRIYKKQVPATDEKTGKPLKNKKGEIIMVDQEIYEQEKTQRKTETVFDKLTRFWHVS